MYTAPVLKHRSACSFVSGRLGTDFQWIRPTLTQGVAFGYMIRKTGEQHLKKIK